MIAQLRKPYSEGQRHMTNDDTSIPSTQHLTEARSSKRHVRRQLQAMIDEHIVNDLALQDDSIERSLFADLAWKDPAP